MEESCEDLPSTDKSCLDLAIQAEQSCRQGDYRTGLSIFESAIEVGTGDVMLLSAIYCQMGCAYFQLDDYDKALEYFEYDFRLTRAIGDRAGEAKACGNLANILKDVGRFDDAVFFCERSLDIASAIRDKVGQSQALYTFGNVYHAKAVEMSWSGVEPGHFTEEATAVLMKAVQCYDSNLCLVKERGDRKAEGQASGKLGHTYHLLGDFQSAVTAHEKRLLIAYEFGDTSAEKRAHCNLGSSHAHLGQYRNAVYHYRRTLQLSRLLNENEMEAQVCYSLGNVYTLLKEFKKAINYYEKHLAIAQELNDRVGEGRVCWTLANAHTALGNHEQAIRFTEKHLEIAMETGDANGTATARMNLADLQQVLEMKSKSNSHGNTNDPGSALPDMSVMESPSGTEEENQEKSPDKKQRQESPSHLPRSKKQRDKSPAKEEVDAKSPVKDQPEHTAEPSDPEPEALASPKPESQDSIEDSFLEFLSRFQADRMDDQRCTLDGQTSFLSQTTTPFTSPVAERQSISGLNTPFQAPGHFLEQLASSQARRLSDQGVSQSPFPGLHLSTSSQPCTPSTSSIDQTPPTRASSTDFYQTPSQYVHHGTSMELCEDSVFFDILEKCQSSRLNDQRCAAPPRKSVTIPDEDFYRSILYSQSSGTEDHDTHHSGPENEH